MPASFSGLGVNLGNLYRLSSARTRSISPENFTGEKGKGGMATEGTGASCARGLGQGWKVSPSIRIEPRRDARRWRTIEGAGRDPADLAHDRQPATGATSSCASTGTARSTPRSSARSAISSARGWNQFAQVSLAGGLRQPRPRVQLLLGDAVPQARADHAGEPRSRTTTVIVYYQINYTLTEVPEDAAYFHAQFRRTNPLPFKEDYTILDGVRGRGHYVGTYMAWGVNNTGWWGEGEIKFFMDGDDDFPTICGTGTEDYFCGAYNFDGGIVDDSMESRYREFTTPYAGLPQVHPPRRHLPLAAALRHVPLAHHRPDPLRAGPARDHPGAGLAHREADRRYLPLQDDIASVAYWYQTLPAAPFPALPDRDYLEVI